MPNYKDSGLVAATTYLTEDEKKIADSLAKEQGRSMSNLLKYLVLERARKEGIAISKDSSEVIAL